MDPFFHKRDTFRQSRCAAPRPCSKKPSMFLPTLRNSLWFLSSFTLLFIAFFNLRRVYPILPQMSTICFCVAVIFFYMSLLRIHVTEYDGFVVTVHSYILVGDFLSRMKICLHECRSRAPRIWALRLADAKNEQCVLQTHLKQRRATKWR